MFEDKRYTNDNINKNKFFYPEDNTGLHDGNDNLNFREEKNYMPRIPKGAHEKKSKRFKGLAIFLILIIVLFVLLITLFGIIHFLSSPEKIYMTTFDNMYNLATEYLKEYNNEKLNYDVEEDILANTGTFNVYTDYPDLDAFSSYNYDYKFVYDNKNAQFDGSLALKNGSSILLNIKSFLRNNKLYLQDSNIYSGIIEVGNVNLNLKNFKNNYDYNDLINLLNSFKNTITPYIVDDNLSKEKETIKVNNKNVKVTSNVFRLNENLAKEFITTFIDNLMDDGNALKSFANLIGSSRKEAIKVLKEIKSNDEAFSELKALEMKIFTEGLANNFIGFKINYGNKEVFKFIKENNGYNFDFILDKIKLTLVNNENTKDIKLYIENDNIFNATVNTEEDTTRIEFNINYEDEDANLYDFDGTIVYVSKKIGDKRQTHKLSVNLDTNLDDKNYNFKLELNNTMQVGGKISNTLVNNAKPIQELNNNELKTIDKNIKAVLNRTPLYNLYEKTLGKNIESILYCDKAYDCSCNEDGCTCKYMGEYNVEREVVCKI